MIENVILNLKKNKNISTVFFRYNILFSELNNIFEEIGNKESFTVIGTGDNKMRPIHIKDVSKIVDIIIRKYLMRVY